jgi:hypothetical protein
MRADDLGPRPTFCEEITGASVWPLENQETRAL